LYVHWTKNLNVSGYELQYSTDSTFSQNVQTFETLANDITQTAVTVTPGTYHIRVRTYQKVSDGKNYSAWSDVKVFEFKIDGTQFATAQGNANSIDLTWAASKGCHGYQIQYSTDENFKSDIKTIQIFNTNTLNHTISNLKAGNYYIRIAAYKTIEQQKYLSDWSEIEMITVQ
jgi:hypothetical protein